jgi:hypothetical protein
MVIDSATLVLISIIVNCITISAKLISVAHKKGYFKKINKIIYRYRDKIEHSIKHGTSLDINLDDISDDENETLEDILELTVNIDKLISISKN